MLCEDGICQRCGTAEEDDFHRIWDCPANGASEDKAIGRSEHLKEMAREGCEKGEDCFWLRGLTPKDWVTPQEAEEYVAKVGSTVWDGGTYYLDGSGGERTRDRRLRRCGWATVKLKEEGPGMVEAKYSQAAFGSLGGRQQTVPRAELKAAIETLKLCRRGDKDVFMHTDCLYVYKGASKEGAGMPKHMDLWGEYRELLEEYKAAGRSVTVFKVKAHAEYADLLLENLTGRQFAGNCLADSFAKEGAKLGKVDNQQAKVVEKIDQMAWLVQDRLVATAQSAMEKERNLSTAESNKLRRMEV